MFLGEVVKITIFIVLIEVLQHFMNLFQGVSYV